MTEIEEIWKLLQIAKASLEFPGLKPLHDKALEQLQVYAKADEVAETADEEETDDGA